VSRRKALVLILICYVISRLVFFWLGVTFWGYSIGDMQVLEPILLKQHLVQSLWYLHMQPPLMNLALGIWMKFLPDYAPALCFKVLGLGINLCILSVMLDLRVPTPLALSATILFMLSPEQIVYENWLFNSWPTMFLLTLAACCLARFFVTERKPWGVGCIVSFGLLVFLNTTYQIVWFGALVGALYYCAPEFRRLRPAIGWTGGAILALYLKNFLLFGTFATSSWFGINLAGMTTSALMDQDRLVAAGKLPAYSLGSELEPPKDYYGAAGPATGIPALDRRFKENGASNYNHLDWVGIARERAIGARWVLRHRPMVYLREVWMAFRVQLRPATWYGYVGTIADRMPWWRVFYERLILAPASREIPLDRVPVPLAFAVGFPLIWLVSGVWLWRASGPERPVVLAMWLTVLYVTATIVLFNDRENNRLRTPIDPYYIILAVFFANLCFNGIKHTCTGPGGPLAKSNSRERECTGECQ
jgi:hypothetical protein